MPYKWDCGTHDCPGVILTDAARPADDEMVRCHEPPGMAYASSCHSYQRWDAGQERFLPCPSDQQDGSDELGELPL